MKWPDALLEPQGKRDTQSQSLGAWDNSSAGDSTLEVAISSSSGRWNLLPYSQPMCLVWDSNPRSTGYSHPCVAVSNQVMRGKSHCGTHSCLCACIPSQSLNKLSISSPVLGSGDTEKKAKTWRSSNSRRKSYWNQAGPCGAFPVTDPWYPLPLVCRKVLVS